MKYAQGVINSHGLASIGKGAFYNCESLINVVIHDSVISIGESVFGGCIKLKSIVIPESVTSIGKDAFFGVSQIIIKNFGLLKADAKLAASHLL